MTTTLPKLVVDQDGCDTINNMIEQLGAQDSGWIAIGIEDADGYAESIAYCHEINAPLIVEACNQHADLIALRDAVAVMQDPKHYQTIGDVMALEAAYEKVKAK